MNEELVPEAMAVDDDEPYAYKPHETQMSFEEWLDTYKPSVISREDGVEWIVVNSPCVSSKSLEEPLDIENLQLSWEQLQNSGRSVNLHTITELAKQHNVTVGKWLFYATTGAKIDLLWRLVAQGVVEGRILATGAKISPFDPCSTDPSHVVCIYNNDYTDLEQVADLEYQIRCAGIKSQLFYKPDIYTYFGIYSKNEWGLRPIIYQSNYDILAGQSKIDWG